MKKNQNRQMTFRFLIAHQYLTKPALLFFFACYARQNIVSGKHLASINWAEPITESGSALG